MTQEIWSLSQNVLVLILPAVVRISTMPFSTVICYRYLVGMYPVADVNSIFSFVQYVICHRCCYIRISNHLIGKLPQMSFMFVSLAEVFLILRKQAPWCSLDSFPIISFTVGNFSQISLVSFKPFYMELVADDVYPSILSGDI